MVLFLLYGIILTDSYVIAVGREKRRLVQLNAIPTGKVAPPAIAAIENLQ